MTSHFTYTVHGSGQACCSRTEQAAARRPTSARYCLSSPPGTRSSRLITQGPATPPRSTGPLDLDMLADGLVASALLAGVERFVIVGYSLGTAVAVRAATRYPERVTGLVLMAGLTAPDNRLRLAAQVWRQLLLDGDRDLLSRFLMFAGTGSLEQIELVGRIDTRNDLSAVAVPAL